MPYHYSDETRETDPHALPNVEVFYLTKRDIAATYGDMEPYSDMKPGWYYWFCFPGCLPDGDGDPIGPFDTEQAALEDARQ